MKKIVQIIILVFLITGCGSLKQGWNNFTAYYNTFYNAKKFYNEGLKKNRNQLPDINPLQPIHVHSSPTNAGLEDFETAIEKGSGILRNHADSKFVIPALFIIGKSYYYRSELFSALEKFQELNALATGGQRHEAIIWLGLTYLQMSNYSQGIEVLEFELDNSENWSPQQRAEAQVVLAEFHVERENWDAASGYLESSISGIEDQVMKAKAHFLLGQIFEKMGDLNRALFSYSQIDNLRTDFDLEFNATRKQAEVSRSVGNYEYAVSIYQKMRRDDKYIDLRSDLQYEIARTLQLKGEQESAIENYNDLLRNRSQPPSDITLAKTYYALGEIYRDEVRDLGLAAAYFDSAASQRVDQALLDEDFDARELAKSFGEYVSIKQKIAEKDSLLNLAEMDEDELELFIEDLRLQELAKIEKEVDRMQEQRDRMLVADPDEEVIEAETVPGDGFLNINNATRLADASLQFQARWGDRPLADNWRRRSAVSGSRFDQIRGVSVDSDQQPGKELAATGIQPDIDMSDIPFTDEEKNEVALQIETQNYQLGNVFFLSLNMADSAKVYYQKVIDSGHDENLVTKSVYSIAEVELLLNNREEAEKWYRLLKNRKSAADYTNRIAERLEIEGDPQPVPDKSQTESTPRIVSENDTTRSLPDRAEELVMLADSGSDEPVRPYLLFDAAKNYMQEAKNKPGADEEIKKWFDKQREIEEKRENLTALKDSAQVMLADTSLQDTQQQFWEQIADSVFSEPDFSDLFPFEGSYWDSTRAILQKIENQYAASGIMPQVKILQETLAKPKQDTTRAPSGPSDEFIEPTDQEMNEYAECAELGAQMDVDGGMDGFMNSLAYPSWTDDVSIRGELVYLFTIEPDGNITSYEQLSRMDRSGIPQAVENGIETNLRFTPPSGEESVQCTVTFPFNL